MKNWKHILWYFLIYFLFFKLLFSISLRTLSLIWLWSFASTVLKTKSAGISIPLCGRSNENLRSPITFIDNVPSYLRKKAHLCQMVFHYLIQQWNIYLQPKHSLPVSLLVHALKLILFQLSIPSSSKFDNLWCNRNSKFFFQWYWYL